MRGIRWKPCGVSGFERDLVPSGTDVEAPLDAVENLFGTRRVPFGVVIDPWREVQGEHLGPVRTIGRYEQPDAHAGG